MTRRADILKRVWFAAGAIVLLTFSGCDEVGPNRPDNEPPANESNFGNLVPVNNIPNPSDAGAKTPGSKTSAQSDAAEGLSPLTNPALSFSYKKGYLAGTDLVTHARYDYLRFMDEHKMDDHLDELAAINKSLQGVPPYPVPEMPPKWSADRMDWLKGFKDGLNARPTPMH